MKSFHGAGLQGGMGAAFPSAHATFPHFMPSSKGFPTMFMGHFGYIELPIPIYHPSHVNELKQIFSLVCLKCLRMKKGKVKHSNGKDSVSTTTCFFCRLSSAIMEKEHVTEFPHAVMDRRPRKRARLGWDVSHTPKQRMSAPSRSLRLRSCGLYLKILQLLQQRMHLSLDEDQGRGF